MAKKFCVLIEDDWEVKGNGLGNVAYHQYLPSLYFMKLARRLGIRLTFMVDVVQQLTFNRTTHNDYNLTLQKKLWDDNLILMKEYGFDVQLHLHPQWDKAELRGDYFHLNDQWNFGRYDRETKLRLINDSIDYLEQLLRPVDPSYRVIAYKAGSWGMQPSADIFNTLRDRGVKIAMGVRQHMAIPKLGVDYLSLEEPSLPYYPDFEDINKVSSKKEDIVIIPLQSYAPSLPVLAGLALDLVKMKFSRKDSIRHFYDGPVPESIHQLSPLGEQNKMKPGLRPYTTHLKIGNQPFGFYKASFRNVINRLKKLDSPRIPIVIECHTKQYHHYYRDIEKFLLFIQDEYGDIVDFGDMTSFLREIENNAVPIKTKNDSK